MGVAWDASKYLPRVSAMDQLMSGFNFIVTLNEFVFGFQSVSGFSMEKPVEYLREGGVNEHQIMVGKPHEETFSLTFRRGYLMRSSSLLSSAARAAAAAIPSNLGRKTALLAVSAVDPQETLESGPALGTIEVFDRYRNLCALYSFLSLGMTSWKMDDLDATQSSIIYEEITIAHTGLTRHALKLPFSQTVDSISNAVSTVAASDAEEAKADKQKQTKAIKQVNMARTEAKELENEAHSVQEELNQDKNQLAALESRLAELEGV